MKAALLALLMWVGWSVQSHHSQDTPKVIDDPEIQRWYQECGAVPGCKLISRNFKILEEGEKWKSETVLILRTSKVIDFSLARLQGKNGPYIVLMVPDHSIDIGLSKVLSGK